MTLQGADANSRDTDGQDVLMCAVSKNRPVHVELLIQSGVDVSSCDHIGRTALHHAAQSDFADIARMLVAR